MPLATNQRMLRWLCICPTTNKWKKALHIMYTVSLIASNLSGLVSSYVYFSKNVSSDLEEALYALLQVVAFLGLFYIITTAILLRRRFTEFLNTLRSICEANTTRKSFHFLLQADQKSEQIWIFYFKYVLGGFAASTVVMAVASVSFCRWTNKNFDLLNCNVYLPYRTTLFWNVNTPNGYAAMILSHVAFGESYIFSNGTLLLLFISICWYHRAFYERFDDSIRELDPQQPENAKKILCELIDFHNSIKEFFFESANVYSLIILTQLICSMVVLALCFFQLDLQRTHLDSSCILLLTGTILAGANLFLYCFFGKMATESYERMTTSLFDSKWPDLPVRVQMFFILMIADTQRPIYYHGFGMANMKLETFGAMFRNVITWFMMFKTISAQ